MYLSESCADSANQCRVSSARRSCTCQRACPGCKCRKIVCLSERIHNICLIMNASARSITCPEDRDGRLQPEQIVSCGSSCLWAPQGFSLNRRNGLLVSTESVCVLNKAHLLSCCCERAAGPQSHSEAPQPTVSVWSLEMMKVRLELSSMFLDAAAFSSAWLSCDLTEEETTVHQHQRCPGFS